MPPDPEEIQEMLMKAQGKTIRYILINIFDKTIHIIILIGDHHHSKD